MTSFFDKLSKKKNQEFVRIATHQLIKDGKTDEEIKALPEEIIPTILENQEKELRRDLWSTYSLGSEFFRSKTRRSSNYQKKILNPYLMIMDAFLFVLVYLLS